jgi:fumarate reductase flavoprotein subunit
LFLRVEVEKGKDMKQLSTDVVVIGSGAGGMGAAVTAAEGSTKVIMFEKRRSPGALTYMLTAMATIRKDPAFKDKAFHIWMDATGWTADAALVRKVVEKYSLFEDWLTKYGVWEKLNVQPLHFQVGAGLCPPRGMSEQLNVGPITLAPTLETMGTFRGIGGGLPNVHSMCDWRLCDTIPEERSGRGPAGPIFSELLIEEAKKLGVKLYMSTPVKKLLKEGDRVTGVIAEDESGERIQVKAGAVIIAAGSYLNSKEMFEEFGGLTLDPTGTGDGDVCPMTPDLGLTGDGMKMAWEVGADKGYMGYSLCYNVPNPGITGPWPFMTLRENQIRVVQDQPYLWVNQSGNRFVDESLSSDRVAMAHKMLQQQGRSCGYLIFDEETREHMEQYGPEWCYYIFPRVLPLKDIEGQFVELIKLGNKNVFLADSVQELAEHMEVDPGTLRETVDQYNYYCHQGHDDLFAKNPKFLRPIRKPRFYALRNMPWAYETIGGVRTNAKGEVLGTDHNAIPGLYAGSNVAAGGLFGRYFHWALPLVTTAWALGCIAGESALEYVQRS